MQLFIGALTLTLLALPAQVLTQADSCFTPIGELGNCVPFKQCQFIWNIKETYGSHVPIPIQNQLRQMACVGPKPGLHLCCPIAAVIEQHSGGSTNNNRISPPEPKRKAQVTVRQATQDLDRIDPRGLELLNSVTECGKKSNIKLSGGETTKIGEFPWLVLLKYEISGRPFLCGGSLITDRFVLSAAHCKEGKQGEKLIAVRLGEHNLDTEEDCQFLGGRRRDCLPPYEEYGVEAIRAHPNYKERSINNDIMIIKLDRPVKFKTHIKPICLPIESNSQSIAYDQSFFISGWGTTEQNQPSSVLLKAVIKRQNLDTCRNYYVDAPVNDNHICAVGEGILHTCRGDSGGPLFFRNSFKDTVRYVQYGIVSLGGKRCGLKQNQPGIFASVLNMLPWITQNLY